MKTGTTTIVGLCTAVILQISAARGAETITRDSTTSGTIDNLPEETITPHLSAEEEAAHVARLARLRELEEQAMEEPAGAASPSNSEERLIEALEALQMEIQGLRNDLGDQRGDLDRQNEKNSQGELNSKPDTH